MAEFTFAYGAMESRKSLDLIAKAHDFDRHELPVVTIKPEIDTRGGDSVFTRAGLLRRADILSVPGMDLRERVQAHMASVAINTLHHIFVDEAELLEPKQINQLHSLTKIDGIPVTAYGLRTNFRTELFEGSERLFAIADTFKKFESQCQHKCGEQAEFNCRSINGEYVFEGPEIAIDGVDGVAYASLCGACYVEERDRFDKITTAEA